MSSADTSREIYRTANSTGYPHISYGLPFTAACAKHAETDFHATHIYLIASQSLARNTDYVTQLQQTLGNKLVGTRYGITSHTPWSEVLEIANEAKELNVDLLVTLGAGSLTDGAKIITLAMENDAHTFEDLESIYCGPDWNTAKEGVRTPSVPIISIPTSLSGGEYSHIGGGTHDQTRRKYSFGAPMKGPALVILDPQLCTSTPDHVWLQSGVRAVDHCVEGLCSLQSTPASDESASLGLKLLIPNLLRTKHDAQDVEARLSCQMGVIEAMNIGFQHHVPMGASHGIGHQLGPLGVGHGETSCILLPAVCKYNLSVNEEQQSKAKDILWSDHEVAQLLKTQGLSVAQSDLGDLLDVVITALGMPRSLKAVGVENTKLDMLAENSLTDRWCQTNPRPLTDKQQIMEILEMVQG